MGVFYLIRAVFGLGGSDSSSTTDVPIEPERRETDDPGTGSNDPDTGPDSGRESATAGTDATVSTDSTVETASSDPDTAAEPTEAGVGDTEPSGAETPAETAETTGQTPDDTSAEAEGHDDGSDTTGEDVTSDADAASVETISGIGPAYADRLADAGVETVPQLLDADPSELAEATGLSEKRISGWIENAGE